MSNKDSTPSDQQHKKSPVTLPKPVIENQESPGIGLGKKHQESPGTGSGKKQKGDVGKDYDKVPPHQYDEEVFKYTCPFITRGYDLAPSQPFSGNVVDPSTITYLLRDIVQPIVDSIADTYYITGKELQWRCVVRSLFSVFKKLAIDIDDDYLQIFEVDRKDHEVVGEKIEMSNKYADVIKQNLFGSTQEPESEGSFQEYVTVHEDMSNLISGVVDFACYVKDKGVVRTPGQKEELCTVALADSKTTLTDPRHWAGTNGCLWQLAKNGVQHAVKNILMGRKKSIYLLVLASGVFCVASIQPYGILKTEKGKLEEDALKRLLHENDHLKEDELHEYLRLCNEKRRHRVGTNDVLPDGIHLVGNLYVNPVLYSWQVFPTDPGRGIPLDTYKLMEGMLRVLIGDRVNTWKPSHLEKLIARYEAKMKQTRDSTWNMLNIPVVESMHQKRR